MDHQRVNPSQHGADRPGGKFADPIVLRKGRQLWIFRYGLGQEGALLARISQLARDAEAELDWVDAAIVSHEISRRLASRLAGSAQRPQPPPGPTPGPHGRAP